MEWELRPLAVYLIRSIAHVEQEGLEVFSPTVRTALPGACIYTRQLFRKFALYVL